MITPFAPPSDGTHNLTEGPVEGKDPLAPFSPHAPQHLQRTDGFEHVADIMVGSFYDPNLDEGCAFEELISFHGGIGGFQTRPFIHHPAHLEIPPGPILGAASVHGILAGWRQQLQGSSKREAGPGGQGRIPAVSDSCQITPTIADQWRPDISVGALVSEPRTSRDQRRPALDRTVTPEVAGSSPVAPVLSMPHRASLSGSGALSAATRRVPIACRTFTRRARRP